jgi:hypothetical protein
VPMRVTMAVVVMIVCVSVRVRHGSIRLARMVARAN